MGGGKIREINKVPKPYRLNTRRILLICPGDAVALFLY